MKVAKFELKELLGIGFTIVVLGIGIGYGLDVMNDQQEDFCGDLGTGYHYHVGGCYKCSNISDTFYSNLTTPLCYTNASINSTPTANANNDAGLNATQDGMGGTLNLTTKLPTIMTVVVASVIIGILVTYLWMRFA